MSPILRVVGVPPPDRPREFIRDDRAAGSAAARAFWTTGAGRGEIRGVSVHAPGPDEVRVRAVFSAVSRGTEALVFDGRVPVGEYGRMRAPFQDGDFPFPVKYGYLNVGVAQNGPLSGRLVFCLFPHQTEYVVPAAAVHLVPDGVPAHRAVLAGTVETAVNALWDAGPRLGDRITVVGGGLVGGCVARLAAGIPGVDVCLVDVDESRAAVAERLGVRFATPDTAEGERDLVVHASASGAGLALGLRLLAPDSELLELSWYGDREVGVPLGQEFHSRRLSIRASQVGEVAPARRGRRTTADRLRLALELLRDPAFDALLGEECAFNELPERMPALARTPGTGLLVRYPPADAARPPADAVHSALAVSYPAVDPLPVAPPRPDPPETPEVPPCSP